MLRFSRTEKLPWCLMQVLQERGETGSRHGRATFAVLLLQVCIRQPYRVHIHTRHAVPIRPHSLSLVALARSASFFCIMQVWQGLKPC